MKCSDISSRLVDFLYEEIPPAERAEFNAHLQGCPTCAAEVKASSRALQRTRTALRGPLNEDPPARVHDGILAAARAAAQPARKPTLPEREGFFARLWKAPWLLPAMGAASVATAVFLIKVIKNPEVLPVREAKVPAMVAQPQTTEDKAPAPAIAPAEPQAEADPVGLAKEEERKAGAGKRERVVARSARTSPASQEVMRKKKINADPLDGIGLGPGDVTPPMVDQREPQVESAAPTFKHAAPAPKATNAPRVWAEPPPRSPSGSKDRKADLDDLGLNEGASGAGANQPRGELLHARPQKAMEAPRPAPAAPAASGFAPSPAPSAAPAKSAPEPVEYRVKAKRGAEAESIADEMVDSAPLRSVSDDKEVGRAEKKGGAPKETIDERVRKADKLYNEKKWYEALTAYRALLDEAPQHPAAPTWRQRFLLAEKAHKATPAVRAKSKISDEALDGL